MSKLSNRSAATLGQPAVQISVGSGFLSFQHFVTEALFNISITTSNTCGFSNR